MYDPHAAHQRLIEYLTATYGDDLLRRDDDTYPVYVFPADAQQRAMPDDVLVAEPPRHTMDRRSFAYYDEGHLEDLRHTRPITNGLTFCLDRLEAGPLKLAAQLGGYFDLLATCDALTNELRAYSRGERDNLRLRERLHATVPPRSLWADGGGRCAGIGIAVLTVFNLDGRYHLILGQRANSLATGPGLYHVVPALMFQPSGPDQFLNAEWSITHQIVREFGEELFEVPEFANWADVQSADYFYEVPAVADLRAMLGLDGSIPTGHQPDAELMFTGMAFNPISTRVEVLTLLMIHDASWYTRSQAAIDAAMRTEHQETLYIPLDTLAGLPEHPHLSMTPPGAAALWLGVDAARETLAARE
jgi:hypothetical protein